MLVKDRATLAGRTTVGAIGFNTVKSNDLKSLKRKIHHYPYVRYFLPLANAYRNNNNLDKCIEVLRQGLSLYPQYWAARVALGRALLEKGDFDQALAELEMAVDHVPENLLLHRLMALIYFSRREFEKAARYCRLVLFVIPHDQECLSIMEEISRFQSRGAKEKPLSSEGKNLIPSLEEKEIITPAIAELYLSQGFREKAIEIYQKLLTGQPDREEWRERIRSIQGETGTQAPLQKAENPQERNGRIVQQLETWLKNIEEFTTN
ncbi:MAG: tetratricopeptide repeat protein [bacterium]